jgi:hypothetical protein
VKALLVAEAGGCCALCGYAELPGALHFHHVDPATKSFALGATGVTRSLAKARAEAPSACCCAHGVMRRSSSVSSGYPYGR